MNLNKHENLLRRERKNKSWEKRVSISLNGDEDMMSPEEENLQIQAPGNKAFLREGKDRLRALISSIDRFESTKMCYREGLKFVSSYITTRSSDKILLDSVHSIPYIPVIREKHRIRNIL